MGKANREAAQLVIKQDTDLSTGARLLLLFLGDLISDDVGRLTAGCDLLGDELGTYPGNVRRWRAELVDAGHLTPLFIGKGVGGASSNHYQLTLSTPPHTDGYPSTYEGDTPPRPLQDPSTYGGKQEQELKKAAAMNEQLWADAQLIAERNGARDVHLVARKIIESDPEASIRSRAAKLRGGGQNPSPEKISPEECSHAARDEEGYCSPCGSETSETPETALVDVGAPAEGSATSATSATPLFDERKEQRK